MVIICVERPSAIPPQFKDIDTTYVRGGRGNPRLIGFSHGYVKGDIEEKEEINQEVKPSKKINLTKQTSKKLPVKSTYDYFNESTHPEIWNNIEWGRDQFKLSNRERNVLRLLVGIVSCGILGFVVWLINLIF